LEKAARVLEQHHSVRSVEIQTVRNQPRPILSVSVNKEQGIDDYCDLPTLLIENGIRIRSFKEDEINLETAFMTLTKGITA